MSTAVAQPKGTQLRRGLRLIPLAAATYFMVAGGPYGIEDILGGAGYLKALVILLVLPLIWSFPTALMIGELASALPEEGGFYVWVRRAMGPFWGYQEAWLSLAASIFDMAICCIWNLLGAPAVGDGSVGLFLLLQAPFAVLVIAAIWHGAHLPAHTSAFRNTLHSGGEGTLTTAILVAMWNYMGWDN